MKLITKLSVILMLRIFGAVCALPTHAVKVCTGTTSLSLYLTQNLQVYYDLPPHELSYTKLQKFVSYYHKTSRLKIDFMQLSCSYFICSKRKKYTKSLLPRIVFAHHFRQNVKSL